MAEALRKAEKRVDLIEYEGATHSLRDQDDQIDLLRSVGRFLDAQLMPPGQRLSDEELCAITQWIEAGAAR